MFDENDFIIKHYICKKTGKYKPQRWNMQYCTSCASKRSYLPKSRVGVCLSCSCIGRTITDEQKNNISETLQGNLNHGGNTKKSLIERGKSIKKAWNNKSHKDKLHQIDKMRAAKLGYEYAYYLKNKEEILYKNKLHRELACTIRSRLNSAIKGIQKIGSAVDDLGCTVKELKEHLETQFLPKMSWSNWSRTGWHIDHIKPLASFDLTKEKEFKRACHYTNLQPLWAKDNLSKGAK